MQPLYLTSPENIINYLGIKYKSFVTTLSSSGAFLKCIVTPLFKDKLANISSNGECVSTWGGMPYPGV